MGGVRVEISADANTEILLFVFVFDFTFCHSVLVLRTLRFLIKRSEPVWPLWVP